MPYHHIAIATKDMLATHEFYTKAMGFDLVRVEKANTGRATGTDGWAKHYFYDTGDGEMMAFWEIHDDTIDPNFPTSISEGLGLPKWSNHIAYRSESLEDLASARKRINAAGYDVVEIDHHWCTSIYVDDPNGIMVEFCVTTQAFTDEDKKRAHEALHQSSIDDEPAPKVTLHKAGETG